MAPSTTPSSVLTQSDRAGHERNSPRRGACDVRAVAEAPQPLTSKIAVPRVSLAAAKAARSAVRPNAAVVASEPANVVPAPHFDLAAFTYSSSTLDHFTKPIAEPSEHRESRGTGSAGCRPGANRSWPATGRVRLARRRSDCAEPIADDELQVASGCCRARRAHRIDARRGVERGCRVASGAARSRPQETHLSSSPAATPTAARKNNAAN